MATVPLALPTIIPVLIRKSALPAQLVAMDVIPLVNAVLAYQVSFLNPTSQVAMAAQAVAKSALTPHLAPHAMTVSIQMAKVVAKH